MTKLRIAFTGMVLSAAVLVGPAAFASDPDRGGRPPNWTGIYFGAHIGQAWADVDWGLAYTNPGFFNNDLPAGLNFNHDGLIGGAQIGAQYQSGPWVFGGELSLSGGFGSSTIKNFDLWQGNAVGELETKVDSLLLATGRLGYASDKWLVYVKGGYAGAQISVRSDDNVPPDFGMSARKWHNGWTVGGGLEYLILSGVSLGVEYNYVDLNADFSRPVVNIGTGAQVGGAFANSDVDMSIHSVTARINFHLNPR